MGLMMVKGQPAFRPHASGLYVPAPLSRERQVWTSAEARAFDRMAKFLASKGLDLFLGCQHPNCKAQPIERLRGDDGGLIFRCAHADRVLVRAF